MFDRERLEGHCERGIAGLVLAAFILGPATFGAVQSFGFLIIWWLTLAILGLWTVRVWISKAPRLLWTPACWFVIAFIAYVWWRFPQAPVEYPAREEAIKLTLYGILF